MLYTKGCVRTPPPPTRATHGRCVLCQCVEGCGEVCTSVHVCVSGVHSLCTCVGFGCARCAQCAECPEPWRRFSASVLRSVRTFAECVGLCRRTRRASGTSRRIGDLCACQEKTAPDRISARGAKAKPAPNPGAFSVRGRPGADLAGFGQIWRPGGYSN